MELGIQFLTSWALDLVLSMGALSLHTPERLAAARKLLTDFESSTKSGIKSDESLYVTLRGLNSGTPGAQRPFTNHLCVLAENAISLLRLRSELRKAFRSQGLLVKETYYDKNRLASNLVPAEIMNTIYLKSDQMNTKPTLQQYNLNRMPVFDAKDLYPAYADTVWAENILLEKICITELGVKDLVVRDTVVGQGYQPIFCIPLPGAPRVADETKIPNVKYVKAAKTIQKNKILTPLLILSSSQPVVISTDAD